MSDRSQRPGALERDLEFEDFAQATAFVNRVAEVAEEGKPGLVFAPSLATLAASP